MKRVDLFKMVEWVSLSMTFIRYERIVGVGWHDARPLRNSSSDSGGSLSIMLLMDELSRLTIQ